MGYKKAQDLLPSALLEILQEYAEGEYLYIPRKVCNRKAWGEINNCKQATITRNKEIYRQYRSGTSVKLLAEQYYLSPKTIYKIIAKYK